MTVPEPIRRGRMVQAQDRLRRSDEKAQAKALAEALVRILEGDASGGYAARYNLASYWARKAALIEAQPPSAAKDRALELALSHAFEALKAGLEGGTTAAAAAEGDVQLKFLREKYRDRWNSILWPWLEPRVPWPTR